MPDSSQRKHCIEDLLQIMRRLRDTESGCPWDIEQTYQSIAPSTLEEAYEVVDAIERGHFDELREELGDLLFQVVFHSQLAAEEQRFDFSSVVDSIAAKLLRRHPHVFPDGKLNGVGNQHLTRQQRLEISQRWDELKKKERDSKGYGGVLDDVPTGLPALSRAAKLQKRASSVGFDWPDIAGVLAKVDEELKELKQAVGAGDDTGVEEELGDLIFAVVNTCRHLGKDPEHSLRSTNRKFEQRFGYIEQQLRQQGVAIEAASLEQMDRLWDEAKQRPDNGFDPD